MSVACAVLPSRPTKGRLAASALVLTALPAGAAHIETPDAFVRRVYALYKTSDNSTGVDRTRPAGSAFYAAPLLDAFAKDNALLHGEIGVIDADPLCACQAWENLRVKGVTLGKGADDTVSARVLISNFVGPQRTTATVVLTLSRTPAGWRIADVGNKGISSVKAALRDEIAQTEKEAAKPTAPKP